MQMYITRHMFSLPDPTLFSESHDVRACVCACVCVCMCAHICEHTTADT